MDPVESLRDLARMFPHHSEKIQPAYDALRLGLPPDDDWALGYEGDLRLEHRRGWIVVIDTDGAELYRGRSVAAGLRALIAAGAPSVRDGQ